MPRVIVLEAIKEMKVHDFHSSYSLTVASIVHTYNGGHWLGMPKVSYGEIPGEKQKAILTEVTVDEMCRITLGPDDIRKSKPGDIQFGLSDLEFIAKGYGLKLSVQEMTLQELDA